MSSSGHGRRLRDAAAYVAGVYAQDGPDIDFWRILHDLGRLDDERLAELIEEDGRTRIARGLPVSIKRYLEPVPDLLDRRDAVDAAIDMTLRSRCGGGRFDSETVDALIGEYPQLDTIIREAVALHNALRSSCSMQEEYPVKQRRVPQDFGPRLDTGESRYELRRVLGIGSNGQVYLAIDRLLSEKDRPALVAIKVLNPSKQSRSYRERLIEEARKARRVDHPNVVRVLDLGVTERHEDFIAYEYVTGGDLFQWLENQGGRAHPREAARLMAKVARGVQAAHSAGLVHCDLNPGNVILTEGGEPKIADFGVAIRAEETRQRDLRSPDATVPIGNLLFISPEQYRCEEGSLTVPSDVYTLGGLLFTLLTGELPNGELDEIEQTHDAVSGRSVAPSVRSLRPELDRDLDAICRRALSPQPNQRHSSAGAFADDLETFLRCEPIPWTRPSALRIARLWVGRKPAVAAISLLLAVSVVALGGLTVYEKQRRQTQEIRAIEAEQARQAEEFRAELERFRAEEQAARNAAVRQLIAFALERLRQVEQEPTTSQFLTTIWNVEYLLQKDVLGSSGTPDDLDAVRFRAVERILQRAEAGDRGDHLEAMLWRTTLAFWLVAAGDAPALERAHAMLDRLEHEWANLLPEGDRWLGYLEAIRSCAEVKRIMLSSPVDAIDATMRAQLAHHRARLERHEPLLGADEPGSPLHALLLDTKVDLYGYLGDAERKAHASARREQSSGRGSTFSD